MTDTDYSVRTAIKEDCETVEPARTKERPILFSGQMVRAILEGRKNQTRRVVKPQPPAECSIHYPLGNESWKDEFDRTPLRHSWEAWGGALYDARPDGHLCGHHEVKCPYGVPGDRLWVRETWQYADWTEEGEPFVRYAADNAVRFCEGAGDGELLVDTWAELSQPENYNIDGKAADRRWRPSIHMPRWASRITLELTDVRVERVQDIKPSECFAEGAVGNSGAHPREQFRTLWDSTNAKRGYGWDANVWVWALTFRVLDGAA